MRVEARVAGGINSATEAGAINFENSPCSCHQISVHRTAKAGTWCRTLPLSPRTAQEHVKDDDDYLYCCVDKQPASSGEGAKTEDRAN